MLMPSPSALERRVANLEKMIEDSRVLRSAFDLDSLLQGIIRAIVEAAPLDERLEQAWTSFMERWDDVAEARIVAQQRDGLIPPLDARRIAKALNSLDVNLVVAAFGRHPQDDPEEVLETMHRVWSSTLYGRLPRTLPAERISKANTRKKRE